MTYMQRAGKEVPNGLRIHSMHKYVNVCDI